MSSSTVLRNVLIAAAVACVLGGTVHTQTQPYRAHIRVQLVSFGVEFGGQPAAYPMVFRGEPLALEIGVVNRYDGPRAAAEPDWPRRIEVTLRPGGRFDESLTSRGVRVGCDVTASRSHNAPLVDDYVEIRRESAQFVKCYVDPSNYAEPGRYTIIADWLPATRSSTRFAERQGMLPLLQPLGDPVEFEVRQPVTEADRLDLLHHLSGQALFHGQPDEGLQFVEDLLRLMPQSITGWTMRARLHLAQGDCRQALTAYDRAAALADAAPDPRRPRNNIIVDPLGNRDGESLREEAKNSGCR